MPVFSVKGVNCPYCRAPRFWTDSAEDYETLKKEAAPAPPAVDFAVDFDAGVDVGRWSERKDLVTNRVFPMQCAQCQRVFVARLGLLNAAEIRKAQEFRAFNPASPDEIRTGAAMPRERWGYIGYTVTDFAKMVLAIKNDFLREAVLRKLSAAGWNLTPLAGP